MHGWKPGSLIKGFLRTSSDLPGAGTYFGTWSGGAPPFKDRPPPPPDYH
jgi:hypothetical protein